MTRFALFFGLALVALAQPAVAQGRGSQPDSTLVRDETSRLAVPSDVPAQASAGMPPVRTDRNPVGRSSKPAP